MSLLLLFLLLGAGPASAAGDDHDIAVEFLKLEQRMFEAQARFQARQAEAMRLSRLAWASAPKPAECDYFIKSTGAAPLAGKDKAERLLEQVTRTLMKASNLDISALCPTVAGASGDYNAVSIVQGPADPKASDRDEGISRTRAKKAIVIERGLILAAGSDDELAAVIGHELGHLALQHLRARQELRMLGDGKSFAAGLDKPYGDIAVKRKTWWGDGYLVETEMEADRFGAMLMSRAGYDPSEFAAVLAKAEPTALRDDVRGEEAVKSDFARRNAAAAKFAAEFPVDKTRRAPATLPRLKEILFRR